LRFEPPRPRSVFAALGFMALGAALALLARPAVERVRTARAPDEPVDDNLLVERVRVALGRTVHGADTIDIRAREGQVTLKGPARPEQIDELVACARRVEGVRGVDNRLSVYGA
jgi:osmotically-inducible protein OsmY